MKRLLRYLAEKNYYTARALWKRGQRQAMSAYGGQPIINYQMGKVGSSTVQASLAAMSLDQPVYHVHFLNPERVRQIEQQRRKYFRTEKYALLRRPWLYEFLFEQIQKKDRRWKLITLVREPVARNVSTFFENLEVTKKPDSTAYVIKSDYYDFNIEANPENLDELIELFFDRLVHERPLRYFDDEIKTVFGIDVFATGFPIEEGYKVYQGENADLLLIRLENLDQCANTVFKQFLGLDDFGLVRANIASDKIYSVLYKAFKRSVRFPDVYIREMYESAYVRQFYSDEEIRGFREGWHSLAD